jgi:hypothetical protein
VMVKFDGEYRRVKVVGDVDVVVCA